MWRSNAASATRFVRRRANTIPSPSDHIHCLPWTRSHNREHSPRAIVRSCPKRPCIPIRDLQSWSPRAPRNMRPRPPCKCTDPEGLRAHWLSAKCPYCTQVRVRATEDQQAGATDWFGLVERDGDDLVRHAPSAVRLSCCSGSHAQMWSRGWLCASAHQRFVAQRSCLNGRRWGPAGNGAFTHREF
jgi:hypothetical protein